MVERPPDCRQACTVVRPWNDAVATELAAEYVDVGLEEPHADIAARRTRFSEEVHRTSKPADHRL